MIHFIEGDEPAGASHIRCANLPPAGRASQKAAKVEVVNKEPTEFLDDRFLQGVYKQKRGVALFVPTRKGVVFGKCVGSPSRHVRPRCAVERSNGRRRKQFSKR